MIWGAIAVAVLMGVLWFFRGLSIDRLKEKVVDLENAAAVYASTSVKLSKQVLEKERYIENLERKLVEALDIDDLADLLNELHKDEDSENPMSN